MEGYHQDVRTALALSGLVAILTVSAPARHMTASLPLSEDPSRPRIDFIVFFVDMTSSKSLTNLKTRLLKVDKDYFAQGRACVVATRSTTFILYQNSSVIR